MTRRFSGLRLTFVAALLVGCGGAVETPPFGVSPTVPPATSTLAISGATITQNGRPVTFAGANVLHVYGGNSDAMPAWRVGIAREFIRNLKDQPVTGGAVYSVANKAYFHSLRSIVTDNRRNGLVTVLCPFGWDTLEVLGLNPSAQPFYTEFKSRMRAIATEFRDEPDVWLEVWNEPYWWQGGRGFTEALWLSDMQDMVDNIRATGNRNIVLVPGGETGQSERAILNQGPQLLAGRSNILFDLHAYEQWLLGASQASISARIRALHAVGAAVIFGETAPFNSGVQMDVRPLLDAAVAERVGVMAWLWKDDETDRASLRTAGGLPNDAGNGAWGTTFRAYLQQIAALPQQ
jgi:mannan endo-1,4-beta-mannosidase